MKGLEPPRLTTLDPKSNAATNYATCAVSLCKDSDFILFVQAVGTKKEATPSGITSFINSTPKDAMKLRIDRVWVLALLCNPPGFKAPPKRLGPAIGWLSLSRYFIMIWRVSQSTLMWYIFNLSCKPRGFIISHSRDSHLGSLAFDFITQSYAKLFIHAIFLICFLT